MFGCTLSRYSDEFIYTLCLMDSEMFWCTDRKKGCFIIFKAAFRQVGFFICVTICLCFAVTGVL